MKLPWVYIFILVFILLKGFDVILLSAHFFLYPLTVVLVLFFFLTWGNKSLFGKELRFYTLFVFLSCLSANYFNNQNFILTFFESYFYLGILTYFLLNYFRVSVNQTEKLLLWLSVVFSISYIIQYLFWPRAFFEGALDTVNIDQYKNRLRMAGSALSAVVFFYGFNQMILKFRPVYILYCLIGVFPIVLMGFRSLSALLVLLSFLCVWIVYKFSFKSFILAVVALLVMLATMQIPIIQTKIEEMLERQSDEQTFANEDYIRLIEYQYYTEYVYSNKIERFLGGGAPIFGTEYYKKITKAFDLDLYWNDWGIIGLSWIIGGMSVLTLVYIIFKAMMVKLPNRFLYLKISLMYLLFGSIVTSMELFRNGNLIVVGVLLYGIYIVVNRMKRAASMMRKDYLLNNKAVKHEN